MQRILRCPACGHASVLVRASCAAEGITDGRNGFIIEENAESMAALLLRIGRDFEMVHQAGQHAMDEIYLSWQECVARARDRYGFILEEKKRGALKKKKQPTDLLVAATAAGMEQRDKLRRIGQELFNNFKVSAAGMMENIQEAEETVSRQLENLREKRDKLWKE